MSTEIETFEVTETEEKTEPKVPTRDELKTQGWTASELDSAEKRGMIEKPEEKKKVEEEKKPAEKVAIVPPKEDVAERRKDTLPDFTFKTPEQEKVFLDAFGSGTPQRAMYFRMKNERQARQHAEQERDKERQEREALEVRIKALETGVPKPQEVDDLGNPIDPEEKPLTLRQLKELQKQEAEEIAKREQEQKHRASKLVEAQETQEEYARAIYPDFDETIEKAKEVMKKIDTLVPEKWQQAKVVKMIRELQIAAANADQIDIDDYHAALIAYEIGKMHPDYGLKADSPHGDASESNGKSKDPKKANGGLTTEQMKRIEENTQRRASSASITGGGGKRSISSDDVDSVALNKMSYSERQKFREKHPDRYAKLLQG